VYTGVYLAVAFCTCTNGLTFGLAGGVSVSLRVSGWAFARRGMALTGSVVWCDVLCCACGEAEGLGHVVLAAKQM
jgi:hypothetical protein